MTSISMGELEVKMKAHAEALQRNVNVLTRNTVRAIINRLARSTPADTSEAVSNWQVTLGAPATEVIPPYFEGEGGNTKAMSAAAMLAANRAVIPKFYAVNGDVLFLSNPVRHLVFLNQGSSTQAPAGFVEAAVADGSAYVRSADPIISGSYFDGSE